MNKIIKFLIPLVKIMVVVTQNLAMKKNYEHLIKRLLSYGAAVFFLISAYIFACISVYHFLLPYCGKALAALSLCLLFLILSFGFIMIGKRSKALKKEPSAPMLSDLERYLNCVPASEELMKTLKKASPQILIMALGGLAITAVVKTLKKKNNA